MSPTPGQPFASIWFDCDSTLAAIEGIDELADGAGDEVRERIVDLTNAAMAGERSLADVYGERLTLLQPSAASCAAIGARYVARAVPGARDLIDALRWLGKAVGIVSGGLRTPIVELAHHLGIAPDRVHAVGITFDEAGRYVAFDAASPLCRNGGKQEVLVARPDSERPMCLVGDGVTDLEAEPVVERFVGFGGVARRENVAAAARYYVETPDLRALAPFLLTREETKRLASQPRFRAVTAHVDNR